MNMRRDMKKGPMCPETVPIKTILLSSAATPVDIPAGMAVVLVPGRKQISLVADNASEMGINIIRLFCFLQQQLAV